MSDHPISRFPVPPLEDLAEDVRARILEVQEKSGFVPNVFLALAHRPAEFRAFFAYHDALMERQSGPTNMVFLKHRIARWRIARPPTK